MVDTVIGFKSIIVGDAEHLDLEIQKFSIFIHWNYNINLLKGSFCVLQSVPTCKNVHFH